MVEDMPDKDPPGFTQRIDDDDPQPAPGTDVPSRPRNEIEGTQKTLQPAVEPNHELARVDSDYRREGTYTTEVPTGVRRPHAAVPAGAPQVTRDPSLSRAVDARAAGVDPSSMGFGERDSEIGYPGVLAPEATEQDPAAENEPARK